METNETEQRDKIHAVLTRLEADGRLTPDNVIEEARSADSPLHSEFTWDLNAAAMITWRSQARALISQFQITVVVHRKEYHIQEFVESPRKAQQEQGYVAFTRIKNHKQLAREFLDRELAIASSYVSKTANYARVLGLEQRVNRVVNTITALRRDAQKKAAPRKNARQTAVT